MSPVEQTSTSPALTPSSSAAARRSGGGLEAEAPVKQFAPPEFNTTASTTPSATACCDQDRIRLRPVAGEHGADLRGPRLTTSARSGLPVDFGVRHDAGGLDPGVR
jgi:hypothetical protein